MNAAAAPLTPAEARRLLAWYAEMGVDVALADAPQDRWSPPAPAPAAAPLPPAAPDLLASHGPEDIGRAARDQAGAAADLEALRAALEGFDGVALRRTATRLVFADGNPAARLMLVGEAPGRDEDREGRPFVGRAGQLLDRMLAAIGLDRNAVYIANIVPWRPPGNRTPTPLEVQACLPFIKRQIELADPDVLVLLGATAMRALTGSKDGILRARGHWIDYDTGRRRIRAIPTFHPAYLLRTPGQKRLAWRDLRAIVDALAELPART